MFDSTRATKILILVYFGYLALGKGFAYAGVPPLFVGEISLAFLIAALARPNTSLPTGLASRILLLFVGLGICQITYDLVSRGVSPLESVRGFALVYYTAYAYATFILLARWSTTHGVEQTALRLEDILNRAMIPVLLIILVLTASTIVNVPFAPVWPISGVPILYTKPTDIGVSLAILFPVTFAARSIRSQHALSARLIWLLTATLAITKSRAALLAIVAAVLCTYGAQILVWIRIMVSVGMAFLLLSISGLRLNVGGRELSSRALVAAVASLVSSEQVGTGNYSDTRSWRSDWWAQIWHDATTKGMVISGHGWGDNLAERYHVLTSIAASDPRALRLPHSIFFSLLGRAGIVTAVLFFAAIAATLVFPRNRPPTALGLIDVTARAGVCAAVIIGITDVYIESPQGGIVLWVNVGVLWWIKSVASDRRQPTLRPSTAATI